MTKTKIALFAIPGLAAVLIGSGFAPAFAGVDEGCTPGFWKQSHHFEEWVPTDLSPDTTVRQVFQVGDTNDLTLLDALKAKGGPSVEAAVKILLKAGVAGILNANHPNVSYPPDVDVIGMVQGAYASGDRDTILSTAESLDVLNNAGCNLPLEKANDLE